VDTAALAGLRGTVGLWTRALETVSPTRSIQLAQEIEDLGYGSLFVPEAWGREAFTHAAILLSGTRRITVGTGIASIWARDAVASANAARTLAAASGDRFVLGLGVSHRPLVERLRGQAYDAPVAHLRRYLDALDAAPMHAAEGATPVPRVLAALGPTMLALAADRADGAFTYLVTPEHTSSARAAIGETFLIVEQSVVLGGGRDAFLERAHAHLEFYTGLDNYRNSWRRLGFGDADWVRGGSERLCDELVTHGDLEVIAARVDQHRAAGADHVLLQVLGEGPEPPLEDWARLAEAVNVSSLD
jgi:probable F420-dependent oxidoreductase